ncbi:MAG: glycoside hydrolase family 38 C-terminal domain-containing protein [Bacteroidota bacterium]
MNTIKLKLLFILQLIAIIGWSQPLLKPNHPKPVDTVFHVVGYAHLDTQWRWDYPTTINSYLKNTLYDNFKLFELYPNYVFNFSGANRYKMMKEYYPNEFVKLKKYVAEGKWFPCGSSMEENDVMVPSAESVIRQVLYGNNYFRNEFGKESSEYMLPDCFGFPVSLPSILSHCGILGFSTQKLSWGSANGIPFNFGVWKGPDGESIIAAFNPGGYTSDINNDLSNDKDWLDRIVANGNKSGVFADYMYYGTGDRGGAPNEKSVQWLEKSVNSKGHVKVISAEADQLFKDISPAQKAKLPIYDSDLLLTFHTCGAITSEAYMKKCNRKNELLAYSAEATSVMADWLGGTKYPKVKLDEAWRLVLGAQFHDILPGTSIPKAYDYAWNDEILAANQFSNVITNAVGAAAENLNTIGKGIPLIVYNPLSIERTDAVDASVVFPNEVPKNIKVFDGNNNEVLSQILKTEGKKVRILFMAKVPSMSLSVYYVRNDNAASYLSSTLICTENSIENDKISLNLNVNGDIAKIYDKTVGKDVLKAPSRLVFQYEKPQDYPAWNMDWTDRQKKPIGYVDGKATIKMIEDGPLRATIEVTREARGSKFVQQIRLYNSEISNRIEVKNNIDWFTKEASLRAEFPLTVSNPLATYCWDLGTIQRGNNTPKKYEVPSHQWFDLTDKDNKYGVSILEDSKYGSDKPENNVLRLTLLYTPGVRYEFRDQATQDLGKHEILYAIYPHANSWQSASSNWEGAKLNQPLLAFQTYGHQGTMGKSISFVKINNPDVMVKAIKKAENSDEIIVRIFETKGKAANNIELELPSQIISANEVNGQEKFISKATIKEGKLYFDITPYHPKTFALKIANTTTPKKQTNNIILSLPFNTDVISYDNKPDGAFDKTGTTYPAELLPETIESEGIAFKLGNKSDKAMNAVSCNGQTITLPEGSHNNLYILAAADEDTEGTFKVDDKSVNLKVQNWSGFIGQWDKRNWEGYNKMEADYNWSSTKFTGLTPGFVKQDNVAYFTTHRHLKDGKNEAYSYAYIFKYKINLAAGAKAITLPSNEKIKILAITVADNTFDQTTPAINLFDTLNVNISEYKRFQLAANPVFNPASCVFEDKPMNITISTNEKDVEIRYTLDMSEPTLKSKIYTNPIIIDKPTTINATLFRDGIKISNTTISRYFHKLIPAKNITLAYPFSTKYPPENGSTVLIDQKRGSDYHTDGRWLGFEVNDLEAVLELNEKTDFSKITIGFLSNPVSWIFMPVSIEISASDDGKNFVLVTKKEYGVQSESMTSEIADLSVEFKKTNAKFIKVKAKNVAKCPDWHRGKGGKAWLFADEISVE